MKRIVLIGLGGAALAAAAGAAIAPRLPANGADETARLLAAMSRATGLEVRANGGGEISLFPTPRIRVSGVSIARPGQEPFALVPEVVGSLGLLPLVQGRVALTDVVLNQPEVALERLPYGEAIAALRGQGDAIDAPAIKLTDARLNFNGRTIDRVEAGLAPPRDGGPATFSGYGRYAGRQIEATAQMTDLAALARSDRSPFRARIEGGGARIMFDGSIADRDGLQLSGDISARAASIGDAFAWLNVRANGRSKPDWPVSLSGKGAFDGSGLAVSSAELDVGGETLLGAARLTMGSGGVPNVEATLDAERLDLNAYLGALSPRLVRPEGGWSASRIDLSRLAGWNLDLRLSADSARLGHLDLGPTAATVAVAKGGLDLSIGEAAAYGGTIGGRLVLEPQEAGLKIRLEGGATDVAIHDVLLAIMPATPIAGDLTTDFALDSAGGSMAEIVAGANGRVNARLADGALDNASRSRTLALAGLRGRIEFDRAEARIAVRDGIARSDDVAITGKAANFSLSGTASLIERSVALKGVVKPAERGWTLPVAIEGPLSRPKLRPDIGARSAPRGEASRAGPSDVR